MHDIHAFRFPNKTTPRNPAKASRTACLMKKKMILAMDPSICLITYTWRIQVHYIHTGNAKVRKRQGRAYAQQQIEYTTSAYHIGMGRGRTPPIDSHDSSHSVHFYIMSSARGHHHQPSSSSSSFQGSWLLYSNVRLAIHTRLLPRAWLDITSTVQPSSLFAVSLQMLAQPHLPVLVNLAIASISGTEVERRKTVKLL